MHKGLIEDAEFTADSFNINDFVAEQELHEENNDECND